MSASASIALLSAMLVTVAVPDLRIAGTYSSLAYHEEGGDLLGYEVRIIPTNKGLRAVVQIAEGGAGEVNVVQVVQTGETLAFNIPLADDAPARFEGKVTARGLEGTVTFPSGASERLILRRSVSYWDSARSDPKWPDVTRQGGAVVFTSDTDPGLEIDIYDSKGHPSYLLACFSGNSDTEAFNHSGLFHCRLTAQYSVDTRPSLLIENERATADWEGRARFLLSDVVGDCAAVHDWGAVRTFRLRNMLLRLSVTDVILGRAGDGIPPVKSFRFGYEVLPIAEPSNYSTRSPVPEPVWFGKSQCIEQILSH